MKLCILLTLFALGINAAPIDDATLSELDFGQGIEHALNQLKSSMNCAFNITPTHDYFSIIGDEVRKINLDIPNLSFDMNITKLRIYGLEKFDIVKSKYDKSLRHYEFELKYDGPRMMGSYSLRNNASDAHLDYIKFDGNFNFDIKIRPGNIKTEFTFGTNETTKNLTITNMKFELLSMGAPEGSESLLKNLPGMFFSDERGDNFFHEIYDQIDDLGTTFIQEMLKEAAEDYSTVEEFSSVFSGFWTMMFESVFECENEI